LRVLNLRLIQRWRWATKKIGWSRYNVQFWSSFFLPINFIIRQNLSRIPLFPLTYWSRPQFIQIFIQRFKNRLAKKLGNTRFRILQKKVFFFSLVTPFSQDHPVLHKRFPFESWINLTLSFKKIFQLKTRSSLEFLNLKNEHLPPHSSFAVLRSDFFCYLPKTILVFFAGLGMGKFGIF
jgi:hypothetical protein